MNLTAQAFGRAAATVALASGANLALSSHADAQIIYSGPVSINMPSTTAGVYLNVATGVNNTNPALVAGWDLNPWSASTLNFYANNGSELNNGVVVGLGNSATLADNLPLGTLIDGSQTFGRTPGPETTGATAFQLNSSSNYIGFRFLNNTTGAINFGWAQFSLAATLPGQPRSIIGFAYEASGLGIMAGDTGSVAVPEPGTYLAGFAAGALALRAWRRRKAA